MRTRNEYAGGIMSNFSNREETESFWASAHQGFRARLSLARATKMCLTVGLLACPGGAFAQDGTGEIVSGGGVAGETEADLSPLMQALGPLAAAGDVEAQVKLGRALLRGDGVDQDIASGLALLEAAASAGSAEAWFRLGDAYSDGRYQAVDGVRALEAYQSAIALGSTQAYVGLGKLLEDGSTGVSADPEAAIAAYEAAIASGVGARAKIALAQGHLQGRFGALSDPAVGMELYTQLAAGDDIRAQVQLGLALLQGDGIDQDVAVGLALLEAAAAAGSADAWYRLGDAYSDGRHVEVDGPRALEAYQSATALGNFWGYLQIGRLLEGNAGVPADPEGAIAAYEAAIIAGEVELKSRAALAMAQGHLAARFGALSDPAEGLRLYEDLAAAGDVAAQVQYGRALLQGDTVPQDIARGVALLEEAAAAGSADAWYRLGDAYSDGRYLAADGVRAVDAYQKAIALGSPWAYLQLGRVLEGGAAGLPADPEGALAAYESAIAFGAPDLRSRAELALAQGHLSGRFGPLSDPEEGTRIYNSLAAANNVSAQVQLARALLSGEDIDQDITRAVSLLEAAAAAGSADAWNRLGDAYSDGLYLEIDGARAVEAYRQAIALGFPWANLQLGRLLEGSAGVPADPEGALAAYETALASGVPGLSSRAEIALAQGHLIGRFGDLSDPTEGTRIYDRLMATGEMAAIVQLGQALLEGEVLEQDIARGIDLLETAAEAGSAEAWYRLGDAYAGGRFLEIDGARAVEAYRQAITLGFPWANLQLGRLLEGRIGVPADPEGAITAYETAASFGNPDLSVRAEIALARGHLGGRFGALSDPAEGSRIFDGLAASGDAAAQVQLGRALVRGDGIERDLSAGLDFLLLAANRSDRAQREIIFGMIRARAAERQSVREKLLDHYAAFSVPPPDYIEFVVAISEDRIDYLEAWNIFTGLPPDQQTFILKAAAGSDRKLYAGLLQGTMVTTGDLNGPVDGLFGPETLRAYLSFCPKVTDRALCQRGPFFRDTRAALVAYIPDLLENGELTQ